MLLETIGNINDEKQQIKHRGHKILTWKTLPRKKGKTTGTSQQIVTISGEVTNVRDLQLFLSQDDGLQEVYIEMKKP